MNHERENEKEKERERENERMREIENEIRNVRGDIKWSYQGWLWNKKAIYLGYN